MVENEIKEILIGAAIRAGAEGLTSVCSICEDAVMTATMVVHPQDKMQADMICPGCEYELIERLSAYDKF